MLLGPQVERGGCNLVDHWLGQAVLAQVNAFDVGLAGVAAFHSDVLEIACGIDGKLAVVLFVAVRAKNPAKLPFRQTERAH